ncbi:MAG: VWA domain-containing protein [Kofleriaceae bacterium]|nr:VWA domain-containing protein [Kofleriaceae bacterium]
MHDLAIWRRLTASAATAPSADQLARDLDELAAQPLPVRGPYLGAALRLVTHAAPTVRIAALRVLTGVRGVPGVRALVAALDDDVDDVRAAAAAALRETARDAPARAAHALFHRRVDVRRAALTDPPHAVIATGAAAYLRADPACADLAAGAGWPRAPLPLAIELYRDGHVSPAELVALWQHAPAMERRQLLVELRGRDPDTVRAYLASDDGVPALAVAAGDDPLDVVIDAAERAGDPRAIDRLVELMPRAVDATVRRAVVALRARLASHGATPAVVGAAVALDARLLANPAIGRAHADAAARGLVRHRWPVRLSAERVDRLLELPWVRDRDGAPDLALGAAVAGLYANHRLRRLAARLTDDAIVAALGADDRGWDEICGLPRETPDLAQAWLARIGEHSAARHAALAARALGVLAGTRLERFVEQLPRVLRAAVCRALVAQVDAGTMTITDERLATACRALGTRLDRPAAAEVFGTLLGTTATATRLVLGLARELPAKVLVAVAQALDDDVAWALVEATETVSHLPWVRELAIARAVAGRADPRLRAWATRTLTSSAATAPATAVATARRALTGAEIDAIRTCADAALARAVAPALAAPVTELVAALATRAAPGRACVEVCAALLGCADPIHDVARELDRFAGPAPARADDVAAFDDRLDHAATVAWQHHDELPVLGHARLYRWEAHGRAVAAHFDRPLGLAGGLRLASTLPGRIARATLWRAVVDAFGVYRYRDRARFGREVTPDVVELALVHLASPEVGVHAARLLVTLVEGGAVALADVVDRVLDVAADTADATRELLTRLVRLDGMQAAPPPTAAAPGLVGAELLARIQACDDLDALAEHAADPRPAVVQEAVLRLLGLGAAGHARAVALLRRARDLAAPAPLIASVALWDDDAAVAAARAIAWSAELPPTWRFHLGLALVERGERAFVATALAAAVAPAPPWFRRDDWTWLVRLVDLDTCARALAASPHHHAHVPAVRHLLGAATPSAAVADALRAFLDAGADRPRQLRRLAAHHLAALRGDPHGLPILLEELATEASPEWTWLGSLSADARGDALTALTDAALIGGLGACAEARAVTVLDDVADELPAAVAAGLYRRTIDEATTVAARRAAATRAITALDADARLAQVADVFAWGIRRGRELTGRMFRVHLVGKERDLGHTYLSEQRIFVSPLPLLRGDPHGREIVEGLLLHELGHHVYHGAPEARALWAQAHREGLGSLLNLIADEHLERNLRARDPGFGDRLKRLGAYAFQHARQEIALAVLLRVLGGSAAAALIAADLEVAFVEDAVRLRRGAVLAELDRVGHPLARFTRALRLGKGNRAGDPRVAAALALVPRDLRHLDMRGLYDVTRRLAALFGGATAIADVFGGPEGHADGERELDVHGNLDDDDLQQEIERILDPRQLRRDGPAGRVERLCINVNPDEAFDKIGRVERIRSDAAAHRALAVDVRRHADRLRAYLDQLGLRWEPVHARTQGRALDRTRLRPLVTRADPRILIARQPVRRTDLFLGTLIDCSGSMQVGANLDRAKRFAALIAEAVRPLRGVEARFFGFTDATIFDAGDADDCGVAALECGGGNNDAAALWHAASLAASSPRRARVLVMISDGLPTECSVAALRGLVTQLVKRRGIVCAQVAVRPLEERCFPHHVLLDDERPDVAVAGFGRMVADLARRALSI